jgi:hypothetical protein
MKFSQVLKQVTELAEAIHTYWERELPKRHPDYPLVNPGEDDGPPPPEEETLRQFLSSLPAETIYKLALIASLRWGTLDRRDLAADYRSLQERFDTPEEAAAILLGRASLADELTGGLENLQKHKINVDKLSFTPVKSRK